MHRPAGMAGCGGGVRRVLAANRPHAHPCCRLLAGRGLAAEGDHAHGPALSRCARAVKVTAAKPL